MTFRIQQYMYKLEPSVIACEKEAVHFCVYTYARDCLLRASMFQILENCEGKRQCHFNSVSNGYFNGDPCGGTYKYLNVTYSCVVTSPNQCPTIEEGMHVHVHQDVHLRDIV